jgi:hypothetical protein
MSLHDVARVSAIHAPARAILLGAVAACVILACGSGDLVVGDDSRDAASDAPRERGSDADFDVADGPVSDGAPKDTGSDAPVGSCAALPGGPGACLATGAACREADTSGATCPTPGAFCCAKTCPDLVPPAPSACDGGPTAPTYDAKGCIVSYACAPLACVDAGGTCVALAPGACATGHIGSATSYSCGSGLGVMCCLP